MSDEQKSTSLIITIGPDKSTATHIVYIYWPRETDGRCSPEASYERLIQLSTIHNKHMIDVRPGTTPISRVLELLGQEGLHSGHITFIETRDFRAEDIRMIEILKANLMAFTFEYFSIETVKRSLNWNPQYKTVGVSL